MKMPIIILAGTALIIALIVYFLVAAPGATVSDSMRASVFKSQNSPSAASSTDPTSLNIVDETIGTGQAVKEGDTVGVLYTGTLIDGTVFDASVRHNNEPFTFTVGAGRVIKGWDLGLIGMRVGGKRKLTIPPQLGYGDMDNGTIPPNSTLIFEIELLKIN